MKTPPRLPSEKEQALVNTVTVRLLRPDERPRFMELLAAHHYIGALQPVGEQLLYVAVSPNGGWRALLVFCSAAKHLRHRDSWIGWSTEQRRRRLSLIANNARFLILPGYAVPNLATRIIRLTLDRLSDDWQRQYNHPLAMVETFVNPEQFQGTVYIAGGWIERGLTRGSGRVGRDYYVTHNKPKRLFVRELCKNARRGLQAETLKPEWASVEVKTPPRCTQSAKQIRSLVEHLKAVPDYRIRIQSYPVWGMLAITALAYLCEGPRGQKDLAKFASSMNQGQRRALGVRRNKDGRIPSPTQPTFCRFLNRVNARAVEEAVQIFQSQIRGPIPDGDSVAIDGKAARRSRGGMILNAVSVPGLHYMGSEWVPTDKTNEIPVARELFKRLDLEGRLVGLDALHTQTATACALVQEAGADYLLTVKGNQGGLEERLHESFTATPAVFSPSTGLDDDTGINGREEQGSAGTPSTLDPAFNAGSHVLPSR